MASLSLSYERWNRKTTWFLCNVGRLGLETDASKRHIVTEAHKASHLLDMCDDTALVHKIKGVWALLQPLCPLSLFFPLFSLYQQDNTMPDARHVTTTKKNNKASKSKHAWYPRKLMKSLFTLSSRSSSSSSSHQRQIQPPQWHSSRRSFLVSLIPNIRKRDRGYDHSPHHQRKKMTQRSNSVMVSNNIVYQQHTKPSNEKKLLQVNATKRQVWADCVAFKCTALSKYGGIDFTTHGLAGRMQILLFSNHWITWHRFNHHQDDVIVLLFDDLWVKIFQHLWYQAIMQQH